MISRERGMEWNTVWGLGMGWNGRWAWDEAGSPWEGGKQKEKERLDSAITPMYGSRTALDLMLPRTTLQ